MCHALEPGSTWWPESNRWVQMIPVRTVSRVLLLQVRIFMVCLMSAADSESLYFTGAS